MVTRTETPHVVPLARQAVEILREVHSLTGHGRYVFPNARYPHRERPMSHGALWSAFRALDIPRERMTMHGFRAMARAILDEVLGFRPDFIEHQLAHAVRDPNGRAYNRTAFLPERRVMMQLWTPSAKSAPDAGIGPLRLQGLFHTVAGLPISEIEPPVLRGSSKSLLSLAGVGLEQGAASSHVLSLRHDA